MGAFNEAAEAAFRARFLAEELPSEPRLQALKEAVSGWFAREKVIRQEPTGSTASYARRAPRTMMPFWRQWTGASRPRCAAGSTRSGR